MTAPIMLKFKQFSIRNFKSIDQISLDFNNLTCIVGMNGAGKSTILQALDFTSQLMVGRIDEWLEQRGWNISQLTNQNLKSKAKNSFIRIQMVLEWSFQENPKDVRELVWDAEFDVRRLKCRDESLTVNGEVIFASTGLDFSVSGTPNPTEILWDYTGSMLSSMTESWFDQHRFLKKIREALLGISSLELLSPAILKKSSRSPVGRIGISGENLASFIHGLTKSQQEDLVHNLRIFYPNLSRINTKKKVGGWIILGFEEQFKNQKTISDSVHINDGLLRILAVLAQQKHGSPTLLLLDEIENGINQEIMGKLVEFLSSSGIQALITTHSPLLLNYLSDEQAVESVYFTYRTDTGSLNLKKFFEVIDHPEILDFAGPGEVYANTDLKHLADKCRLLDMENSEPKK
ncbi:ATP-binding cassette domain-containing protein [Neisseria weixii]|uniref:ATP-binding cassette domain-containing protein n=1 Tax=Neisseria weixii TaxID=1853276 RepID=A0A3N4MXB6_9NEIS|nr:ATP-binding protein [Neisseria weixii]RPD86136.1 ATP-binding cassette domain-containing protein [Neisseria weixii]RPD86869.1 ATP-binding cassette domain-containing protein [Neisseria weixii]